MMRASIIKASPVKTCVRSCISGVWHPVMSAAGAPWNFTRVRKRALAHTAPVVCKLCCICSRHTPRPPRFVKNTVTNRLAYGRIECMACDGPAILKINALILVFRLLRREARLTRRFLQPEILCPASAARFRAFPWSCHWFHRHSRRY